MKAILGTKQDMTRVFKEEKSVPCTIIDVSNCYISKKDENGFELGIGENKKANKALKGNYKEAKKVPSEKKFFKGEFEHDLNIGDEINPSSTFDIGDKVTITGTSKGKGFQGVVKRWGFHGGPRTHGQSDRLRAPGSIGAGTDPGRVWKGKKMGGRMGGDTITLKNIEILDIKDNFLVLSGPIPGAKGKVIAIYTE
jgi:large subunit ribosomal protein L3